MVSQSNSCCQSLKKQPQKAVNRIVRVFKYLAGFWAAIAVYVVFSLISGPRGLSAYNQLLAERGRQQANLDDLAVVNEELEKITNSLLYDKDTLLVHARQLGYGQEDERYIRIVGLGGINTPPNTAGKVYFAAIPDFLSDKIIKITALCIGLAVFAILFVLELIESRTR